MAYWRSCESVEAGWSMLETMTRGIETSPTDNDRRYLGYAGKYL